MTALSTPPPRAFQTFLDMPLVDPTQEINADFVFIGMPYGDAYSFEEIVNEQSRAPAAVRRASQRLTQSLDRYDFDIGGTVFNGKPVRLCDAGDVFGDRTDLASHYTRLETLARRVLSAGAFPITMGGDHGIPIPIFRALADHGPVTLVHVDAHLDWRDAFCEKFEGLSSTIRRASELPHIDGIYQLGIRGQGSARPDEVAAALDYGAHIVTMAEWERLGTRALLDIMPMGGNFYITIDADGLDPAVMPAVSNPQPGGVTYRQIIDLIRGLTQRGRLLGMDIVEIAPAKDVNELTALTAGHIILNAIGAVVRSPYGRWAL
ncbi:arginase family protein [Pelagibacterium sp. 26DY04]|uniref:arginase family protein n=1 Tax=Pelagibacterium sp. 26DY04 TaxID=2967130 RepID=UPI0028150F26|nr:arginase family protein [Pelagibacterium sp. 26DY04]WMT85284.1 arginase family protein [Pelagibacterium sp. 26DY04]